MAWPVTAGGQLKRPSTKKQESWKVTGKDFPWHLCPLADGETAPLGRF